MIHGPHNTGDIKTALAKDLLRKILTTECDGRGKLPFPDDEVNWAFQVSREKPEWARETLKSLGIE